MGAHPASYLIEPAMDLNGLLQNPPRVQRNGQGECVEMGLTAEALTLISKQIDASSHTLETGCGVSTVAFALAGSQHICITPAEHEIQRIREYCEAENIPVDQITFYADSSERVLPSVECEPLDLVLIDGRAGSRIRATWRRAAATSGSPRHCHRS